MSTYFLHCKKPKKLLMLTTAQSDLLSLDKAKLTSAFVSKLSLGGMIFTRKLRPLCGISDQLIN